MNIPEHWKAINKLDAQIAKLLNERTKHVLDAAQNLASGKIRPYQVRQIRKILANYKLL